jgi:hypothetical protein
LIELPQEGYVPDTAKVIANASVTLVKKAAKGDPITRNGVRIQEQNLCIIDLRVLHTDVLHLQGRGFFELVRAGQGHNKWRIRAFKTEPAWYSGNWDVFSP